MPAGRRADVWRSVSCDKEQVTCKEMGPAGVLWHEGASPLRGAPGTHTPSLPDPLAAAGEGAPQARVLPAPLQPWLAGCPSHAPAEARCSASRLREQFCDGGSPVCGPETGQGSSPHSQTAQTSTSVPRPACCCWGGHGLAGAAAGHGLAGWWPSALDGVFGFEV